MDLLDIQCVVAAADHGGFTAAASALSLAQPSLSKRIAALERELGEVLFHRIGRGVVPTEAGEAFLEPARAVLAQAASIRSSVSAVRGLERGELRVSGLPTIVVTHVVPLAAELRRHHPGLRLRLTGADDAEAVADAVAGARADVGLCDLPVRRPHLTTIPLFDQELVAVLPPGSPASTDRVPVARLGDHPVITLPPGTSTRRVVEDLYERDGRRAPVMVETDQRDALIPLVLDGAGLTFVSEPLAAQAASFGAVVVHLTPAPVRPVGLVLRPGHRAPALQAFIDAARQHYGTPSE